ESFCTYTESIYVECQFGKDTAIKYINAHKAHIDNKKPIVGPYGVNEEGDGDMYSKGALFLNTIRSIVNDDSRWWALIKGMCDTTFKMNNIGYADVLTYFNHKTGKDLTTVFEQYLKRPAIPVLHYKLKKIHKGQYEFTYYWQADVTGFTMPVIVCTKGNSAKQLPATTTSQTVTLQLKKETDFKIRTDLLYVDVKQN
ncbi:MAG: hypothetical protein RLZZ367_1423, partial [Bacteroidota bacterium]